MPTKSVLLASMIFLGGVLPAGAADLLDGIWTVTSPLWAGAHLCTFRQTSGALTGSCSGPHGRGESTGTVSGDSIAWTWNGVTPRRASVWRFAGTLEADGTIRGTLRHGPRRNSFVARRPALS